MRPGDAPSASKTRSGGCGWPTGTPRRRSIWSERRAHSPRWISRRPRASWRGSSPLTRISPKPGTSVPRSTTCRAGTRKAWPASIARWSSSRATTARSAVSRKSASRSEMPTARSSPSTRRCASTLTWRACARRSTNCSTPAPPRRFTNAVAGESARAIHVIAGEWQRVGRCAFLAGEHLVDVHPLVFEAVRAPGEIDLPDAVALVPCGRDRLLPVLFQALGPLEASQCVMTPQRLGVRNLEPRARHLAKHDREMRELPVREHVLVDEFPRPQPHPAVVGVGRSDAVIHDEPAFGQQRADFREISLEMAQAHMLEHPDARDLVEDALARNVAIVLQAHLAAALEPLLPNPPRGEFVLVPAEGDARGPGSVFLGRAQHERTPAAADVEKPLARLEHELVEDVIELLLLSELQRIGLAAEIGAGIHHVPVQPQRVEVVRDVVVVLNGFAIALAAVAPDTPQPFVSAGSGASSEAFGHAEHLQNRPFDPQGAFHVGLAELHQVGGHEEAQRRRARHADFHLGLAREIVGAAVPQLEAQRDGCGPSELRDQPFNAVFEEHVVLPEGSNIIASQARTLRGT